MSSIEAGGSSRIPVAFMILGYENNREAVIRFFRSALREICLVADAIQPTATANVQWVHEEIANARKRRVRIMQIVDITTDNLPYCKALFDRVDELRHLGGIKAVMGVSDTMFMAMVPSLNQREEHDMQFIESESESVVQVKHLIFNALWERGVPAQSRFEELAEKSGTITTVGRTSKIIDRIYVCVECRTTFIHSSYVEDHKVITGHVRYHEFPLT